MVLPSAPNPIKFSAIQTEFGGTNPISLSEYYTNAGSGFTAGIAGLPAIGSVIRISNFHGKQKGGDIFGSTLGVLSVNLDNFKTWHSTNADTYKTQVTNWYNYTYDGPNTNSSTYIDDGGGDMYDVGNYISFENWLSAANVRYGTVSNASDKGYFVSAGPARPHISVGWIGGSTAGTILIRCSGDVGSDGSGTISNYSSSYTTSNGRSGSYWANINYNAGDPTIGDVWFTITDATNWGSAVTSSVDGRKVADGNAYNHYISVTGKNFLLCKVLLSRTSGQLITSTMTLNFITNYVNALG
jgi:hypothetical protein